MMPEYVYVSRMPCGCAVDVCPVWDDDTDSLWLYLTYGNGWTVTRHAATETIDMECDEMKAGKPLTTQVMF